ncbi:E3 ubiquitin-protein ligase UPL3 [Gracilariopsis chorda]|uniref:HECT-type E3 ubiquitin transferase n=1 Tax=Gracilariopsis chorda TaxID=448386 RepID=A0A2V3J6P1_9FLOR|nr:E3 ubiquitin-protein ligase UPL3 [Gracilariopsis chorda]|eukprot:PXF50091.1 E3 ubiquitin-protein ligase UPL3 [Gracilariopsis chorda]
MSFANRNDPTDDSRADPASNRRSEDGPSSLGSDRAAPTTLQGLLRRLGADLRDIFPNNGATSQSRLQHLRTAIVAHDSTEQQMEALQELCEFLSVGTEESLVSFSVNLFVAPLVNLLRTGTNVEVKIYAARALTHMMEALPSSSSAIALNGAAGPLCQNLLSIEYIDLAEQSLSALHKLSVDYPQQIVSANGFEAVLSFIDFFSIGVQRMAAATACNLCRQPRGDAMDMISHVLPTMMRLLSSDDQRIRESALQGFTKLAEAYRSSSEKLESLCGDDLALIEKVLSLIVPPSPPALSPQSYSSALRMLAVLARGSAKLGLQILDTDTLIMKLKSRLTSGSTMHSVDCLNLADSLLPDTGEHETFQGSSTRSRRRRSVGSAANFTAIDAKRREALEKDPSSLRFFGKELFETLMRFYISSADSNARRLALSVMSKFITISPQEVLTTVIHDGKEEGDSDDSQTKTTIRFCPFVAALLGENSSKSEALVGLAMTSSALEKLPSLREAFVREGVVHEIVRLASVSSDLDGEKEENSQPRSTLVARGPAPGSSTGVTEHPSSSSHHHHHHDHSGTAINLRDMDSVWSTLAVLQRGSVYRGTRAESSSAHHRISSRALQEFRIPNLSSLPTMVPKAARSILTQYLGGNSDNAVNEELLKNSVLDKLTAICESLNSASDDESEGDLEKAISDFISLLTAPDGLTVFEISRSAIMEAMASFFAIEDNKVAIDRTAMLVKVLNKHKDEKAFTSLINSALGVLSSEEKLEVHNNESTHGTSSLSVNSGLRQLTQPFKLRLKRASAEEGGEHLRDYSNHIVLIEPLATMASVQEFLWPRVRAVGRPTSDRGTGSHRPRRTRPSRGSSRDHGSRHGEEFDMDENDSGADENQLDGDVDDDRFRVEEFFEVAERMIDEEVVDGDHIIDNSDASDEDVSSVEEEVIEQGHEDSEDNERDGPDAFGVDQLSTSLPPVELDHETLGQAPTRAAAGQTTLPRDQSSRHASASRQSNDASRNESNFRSYAAALAENMPETLDVSDHPNSAPRSLSGVLYSSSQELSFSLNGTVLPYDCSILRAVVQTYGRQRGLGPALWSDVHTLVYAKHQNTTGNQENTTSIPESSTTDPHTGEGSSAGPVRRSQRLQENKEKSRAAVPQMARKDAAKVSDEILSSIGLADGCFLVPQKLNADGLLPSIASVVAVLKHLYWILEKLNGRLVTENSKSFTSQSEGDLELPFLLEDPEVQFVSHKLTAKLIRQLSDPLALCGEMIPTWCFTIAREASFLLPFDTRRILFQSTSLGVSRALHLLQTRVSMAGVTTHRSSRHHHRESETRIGRITRQKVRVHRDRILESAIKVMNMYSSHGTVLEVEYFNEAGTGLGPTLEFYTLTSRELQMVDLKLWRSSDIEAVKNKAESESVVLITPLVQESTRHTQVRHPTTRRRSRRHSSGSASVKQNQIVQSEPPSYVVPTGSGLFPSCLPIATSQSQTSSAKTCSLFQFIGRLLGKALIDGRLLDLRFSETFSQLLLAYCRVIFDGYRSMKSSTAGPSVINEDGFKYSKHESLSLLESIDREKVWCAYTSGTSVMTLLDSVDHILAVSLKSIMKMIADGEGDSIPGLSMTFVLPGDDSIELVKDGSNIDVDENNAEEFVRRVAYHVLFGGVYQQAEALLRGLGELIDITNLLVFKASEIELLFCGPSYEKWTVDFLVQATRCDHGFTHESPAVKCFLLLLSELDQEDQQRFVQFTTGSPALPLGGLRNLHPRLTIVKRTPESGRSPDQCLPTVMTCTNYFKLPDYSSYEIAKKQVMYAVREGQRSFHLS